MNSGSSTILSFGHYLGSNCQGVNHLQLIDPNTLVFSSGNLLHFLDIGTKHLTSRQCAAGTTIGCITINPVDKHLAIGESGVNGIESKVHIYDYPSMNLVNVCKTDSSQSYIYLGYSYSGELLASQSTPEYVLSIWNWRTATILLQFKHPKFENIFDLKFSHYNDRFLFTGGVEHLHFWNIVRTFTGLKLQHSSGRFGKFQMCDILSVCTENDSRVLTNCEWGNILAWEDGCIKFEVCQKNRQPCHNAVITQIYWCEDRIYTIGMDNFLKIWFWDAVAIANLKETEKLFEIESIYEFEISSGVSVNYNFLSFAIDERSHPICYVHDGNGTIWRCSINKDLTTHQSETLFRANSNALVDITASPCTCLLATFDRRGVLRVYNYVSGDIIFYFRFSVLGSAITWGSTKIDAIGKTLFLGFVDGTFRTVCLDVNDADAADCSLKITQYLKPHTSSINKIFTESTNSKMFSSAEDKTMFVYNIINHHDIIEVQPVYFVEMPAMVHSPIALQIDEADSNIILGGIDQSIAKIVLGGDTRPRECSYSLDETSNSVEIINIPSVDCNVIQLVSLKKAVVWVLMSNGLLHEFDALTNDILALENAVALKHITLFEQKLAVGCLFEGGIVVQDINFDSSPRLTTKFCIPSTNEIKIQPNGLCFTNDYQHLLSFEANGCIACFEWNMKPTNHVPISYTFQKCSRAHVTIPDISDPDRLSLEQQKRNEMQNIRKEKMSLHKTEIMKIFEKLKSEFSEIKERNNKLPVRFQLPLESFEIDRRISEDLQKMALNELTSMREAMKNKIDFIEAHGKRIHGAFLSNVEHWPTILRGFRDRSVIESFGIYGDNDDFVALKIQFEDKEESLSKTLSQMTEAEKIEQSSTDQAASTPRHLMEQQYQLDSCVTALIESMDINEIDVQTKRLYKKYMARKQQEYERKKEWQNFESKKPVARSIKHRTDISLNEDQEFDTGFSLAKVIGEKYQTLLSIQRQIYELKKNFNENLLKLKEEKFQKNSQLASKIAELQDITIKMYPDNEDVLNVAHINESSIEFDGSSFREVNVTIQNICADKLYSLRSQIDKRQIDIGLAEMLKSQSLLLAEIEQVFSQFDVAFGSMETQKMETLLKIKFLELHYFTIYQELIICNEFEKPYHQLMETRNQINVQIKQIEQKIGRSKCELKEVFESSLDLVVNFTEKLQKDDFFKINTIVDKATAQSQLKYLNVIASTTAELPEFEAIKPIIDTTESLLNDWIALNVDLQTNDFGFNTLQKEKDAKLNNIDFAILLPEKVFNQFHSPDTKLTLDDNVLVNKDKISKLRECVVDYEVEINNELAKERLLAGELSQQKSICGKLNREIAKLKSQISDKMLKKFGAIIDFDEMEEEVLKKMLMNQSKSSKIKTKFDMSLEKRLEEKKKELLSVKQRRVEKLNLLISLQEDLNEVNDDLIYQKKLKARHDSGTFAIDEQDLEKLQEISKQQKIQIKRVVNDIQTLRMKIKPQEQLKLHDHVKSSPNRFMLRQYSIDEEENSERSESPRSEISKETE